MSDFGFRMRAGDKINFIFREKRFIIISLCLGVVLYLSFIRPDGRTAVSWNEGPDLPSQEEIMEAWKAGRIPAGARFAFTAVIGVFAALFVSGLAIGIRDLAPPARRPDIAGVQVPWGVFPVVKTAVYTLFALMLFQMLEAALSRLFPGDYPHRELFLLIRIALFQNLVVLGLIAWFFRKSGHAIDHLNLRFELFIWSLKRALKNYIAFFPALTLTIIVSYLLSRRLELEPAPQPLVRLILAERGFFLFWLGLLAVVLAPLVEEMFFRGFFYPALKNKIKMPAAILLSSLLFSLAHFELVGLLPIFALGVLLAWSYEQTGQLMVPILIHALHNGLFLVYSLAVFKISGGI